MFHFPLKSLAWVGAGLCIIPITAVGVAAVGGTFETWSALWDTVLPRYIWNTIQLSLMVAIGTAAIGTGAAWLVTMCRFPGSRVLEIVLALPLAFPAYVLAYAYTDLLDHPGAVQTALRAVTGWGPRDYWFPEIRSLPGAALMLIFVLYPYVYLLVRAAFLRQSPTAYFAARTMGHGPWSAFFRVSLPVARPAIAGGTILALMETIADYGTVAHFGVQTFATGIYQAWFSMGDRAAASQLAFCLMLTALFLVVLEARQRGGAKHHQAGNRIEAMTVHRLSGWRAIAAIFACLVPVLAGFVIPIVVLLEMAISSGQNPFAPRYIGFVQNSLTLAAIAAVLTVVGAVIVGYRVRLAPGKAATITKTLSGIGYALPGSVIAVGLLVPFARLDNAVDAFMREHFDISTGLVFTGSIALLVMTYIVRFMAAALSSFDTGMSQIRPNVDAVARTLGATTLVMLVRVHLPLMRASLLTAVLIVFVDTMKELPATLILRPFNFDTLAVQAHRLASDERLAQAAVPSLVIVAFGLLPVILLCRTIARTQQMREPLQPQIPLPIEA
ncbi:ABC transporter permease [Oricola thermophila]|uniref:Iron ABC transporter permease n=1 Tax=Oricola thermophila TaxID=2742145 RepID=A0A6N1V8Y8_9HYPH|nr:iron ABC transporter permease [Oricola thermophila]QKV17430.1 iron ABC transporter permease [Oricola thermophila]